MSSGEPTIEYQIAELVFNGTGPNRAFTVEEVSGGRNAAVFRLALQGTDSVLAPGQQYVMTGLVSVRITDHPAARPYAGIDLDWL